MCRHVSPMFLAFAILLTTMAQSGVEGQTARSDRTASTPWSPPRTADGRPSLEGVWENNSATPLERPAQLANKPRLTDEELASMERRARELFTPESDAVFGDGLYVALLAQSRRPDWAPPAPTVRTGFRIATSNIAPLSSSIRLTASCRRLRRPANECARLPQADSGESARRHRRCRSRIAAFITDSPICLRPT